jgi:hypothetical protein
MARSVTVSKGLVVKQKENQRNDPVPNNSITRNQLSDEVRYYRIDSIGDLTVPSGFTLFVPVLKIKNGHTYTVPSGAILACNELIVEPGGTLDVLPGGEFRTI